MSIDKSMKYFTRLDYQGRRIAGSGVIRRKKPSIGRWVEETETTCCFPFTSLTQTPADTYISDITLTILCDDTEVMVTTIVGSSTDIDTLVSELNSNLAYLGTFSTDGTDVILHLHQDIADSICAGELTMTVTGTPTTTTSTTTTTTSTTTTTTAAP